MTENEISYIIRGAIFEVYNELGPGLLESAYHAALLYQLQEENLTVINEVYLPINYHGIELKNSYRLDLLVEDKVIIEIKSVETLLSVHHKQLLTYLKLSGKKLGILVNFTCDSINESIFRKVNNL